MTWLITMSLSSEVKLLDFVVLIKKKLSFDFYFIENSKHQMAKTTSFLFSNTKIGSPII